MMNLLNHATKDRCILTLYDTVHFGQAQRIQCALLIYGGPNAALDLLDFYCCHCNYPLNTFSKEIPRCCAIVRASRISLNAKIVAFTRL